jgi:hypothetical protein
MAKIEVSEVIAVCVPRAQVAEVRRLAKIEFESPAVIFRRLLRIGLRVERARDGDGRPASSGAIG